LAAGRITDDERAKRLFEIERLEQEGLSDSKIAETLGLSLPVVKRAQKYLENLKKADITPEVLAEKRAELYLEYTEIAEEAKRQFELYKNPSPCGYCSGTGKVQSADGTKILTCLDCKGQGSLHYPKDANRFLITWSEVVEKKAKLFGLDNIKSDNIIQFNQFNANEYIPDMKITGQAKALSEKLSCMLKENHEHSVSRKNRED